MQPHISSSESDMVANDEDDHDNNGDKEGKVNEDGQKKFRVMNYVQPHMYSSESDIVVNDEDNCDDNGSGNGIAAQMADGQGDRLTEDQNVEENALIKIEAMKKIGICRSFMRMCLAKRCWCMHLAPRTALIAN